MQECLCQDGATKFQYMQHQCQELQVEMSTI